MTSIRETIAKNFSFYRKKSGLTQKQVAEKLGVKNSAVSNWEKCQNSIDIDTLVSACHLFGVTLNDMYGEHSAFALTDHEKQLVTAYRSNPSMQQAVDKLLGIDADSSEQDITTNENIFDALKDLDIKSKKSKAIYKK